MKIKGTLEKMRTSINDGLVEYILKINDSEIKLNELISKEISFTYTGNIYCVKCGTLTYKSFSQGFCYQCFKSAPETEECVLKPELCRAHEGIARDMEYAKKHCLTTQHVYISLTSGFKVGVTRHTQIPTRWIDQGATEAIIIANTPNRYTAGIIEVELKQHIADKTNWRKMLSSNEKSIFGVLDKKQEIINLLPSDLQKYVVDSEAVSIKYPGKICKGKISTHNFDNSQQVSGILKGIKGQYLIFEDNSVLNIRKFGGYEVECEY